LLYTDDLCQAGDPVEFEGITSVFSKARASTNPLLISSIKGNIGHAEAASGAAGLAKLLMMIKHGQAPPQVGLKVLNPKVAALKGDNTVIPQQLLEWPRLYGMPRRALLNNFGAAGSNACLILEEYVPCKDKSDEPRENKENSAYVFVLSAKDNAGLERYRKLLLQDDRLRKLDLRDLAYTSTARRTMLESRLVVAASTSEELFQSLSHTRLSSLEPSVRGDSRRRVVFVFSGQGSQYVGMGKELFETTPRFREDILQCERILAEAGYPSILPLIHPPAPSTQTLADCSMVATHCAVFAVEYALARLYRSWGIHPDALLGHSLGEYAAFVHANVLSLEDALLIIARRATMVEEMCEVGTSSMLSANASAPEIRDFLSELVPSPTSLAIACDNSPQQCVVSGPTDQIDNLASSLQAAGIKAKKLEVSFGYHSPTMEVIRLPFTDYVSRFLLQEPSIPVGLGLYGRMHRPGDINHEYFASQAINPVRFRETAEDFSRAMTNGETVFLDIGPHPVVLPMVRAVLQQPSAQYLSSLRRDAKNWTTVCQSVAHLVRSGFDFDFQKIYEGQDVQLVDMPLYPFGQEEFVVPYTTSNSQRSASGTPASLAQNAPSASLLSLESMPKMLSQDQPTYKANQRIEEFISGHRVAGLPICPASVYIELALQAARSSQYLKASGVTVENIVFSSPIVRHDTHMPSDTAVQVTLSKATGRPGDVSFRVSSGGNAANQKNCEGLLKFPKRDEAGTSEYENTMSARFRGPGQHGQLIKRKMLYEMVFSRVVAYSELYQTIDYLELSDSGQSAWGSFRLRQPAVLENSVSQPVFVDTLLHAAGFLANCAVSATDVCICVEIESVHICADEVDYTEAFRLYTEISSTHKAVIGNSFAYDSDGKLVGSIQGIVFRRLWKDGFTRSLQATVPTTHSSYHGQRYHGSPDGYSKKNGGGINGMNGIAAPVEDYSLEAERSTSMQTSTTARDIKANGSNGVALSQATADTPTVDQIYSAVAEVAGLAKDRVNGKSNLQHLGLDSFMAFEMLDLIKVQFGLEIPHKEFESCQTPDDIVRLIKPQAPPPSRQPDRQARLTASKCLALIQRGPDKAAPLYLIHDGSGVCSMYSAISSLGRTIFGISCDPDNKPRSVSDMAAAYASLINTAEPFFLGGQ